jgi:hypothetical protein
MRDKESNNVEPFWGVSMTRTYYTDSPRPVFQQGCIIPSRYAGRFSLRTSGISEACWALTTRQAPFAASLCLA